MCGVEEEEAAAAAGGEVGREAAPQCCERPGGFSAALRRAGAASFPHCTARARGGHGAERARGERTRRGRACAQDRGGLRIPLHACYALCALHRVCSLHRACVTPCAYVMPSLHYAVCVFHRVCVLRYVHLCFTFVCRACDAMCSM